jgi:mono/diheme cytochrome c family protein
VQRKGLGECSGPKLAWMTMKRMSRKKSFVATLALIVAAGALLVPARADEDLKNPFDGNAEAAKEGKQLFLKTGCYACHGRGRTRLDRR